MTEKTARPSRTPHLDSRLEERYQKDSRRFRSRTLANLIVAVFLLAVVGVLSYFAIEVVGLKAGGDGLALLIILLVLIVLAILDDVRWRMALVGRMAPATAH